MTQYILGKNVYQAWAEGTQLEGSNRSGGNVFFGGRTIYSYGRHFPMAIRFPWGFLVNGDTYSATTSKHQSCVRAAVLAAGQPYIILPFSALRFVDVASINLVDVEPDRAVPVACRSRHCHYPAKPHTHSHHLLGRAVIEVDGHHFLSGTDETATNPWRAYFLAELPGPVGTVAEALELLKPEPVRQAEANGLGVKRQGEWYFVPTANPPRGTPQSRWVSLSHRDPSRAPRHRVTRSALANGQLVVGGTVRHVAGEHKMLRLDGWHEVYENTAVRQLSARGRVD